ncbi:hypothetical protein SLS62_003718 [Diatrype stigma]|uniref:Uncharacterized protein n=1 Tax=Diatrype stigma TaxID=117547 RepID=A0AAN9UUN8_9PEZI
MRLYTITSAALHDVLPLPLLERVLGGSWQLGDMDAAAFEPATLAARLSGFRAVFVMSVPLMGVCLFASFFVTDVVLQRDSEKKRGGGSGGGDEEVDDAPQPQPEQLLLPGSAGGVDIRSNSSFQVPCVCPGYTRLLPLLLSLEEGIV